MDIDVNITYDDLSEETKQKIRDLEAKGFKVTLKYPQTSIQPNVSQSPIQWPLNQQPIAPIPCTAGSSGKGIPEPPYEVYYGIRNCEARVES